MSENKPFHVYIVFYRVRESTKTGIGYGDEKIHGVYGSFLSASLAMDKAKRLDDNSIYWINDFPLNN